MIKFNSLEEMVEAYKVQFNNSYANDPEKSFTTQNVMDVCVRPLLKLNAKVQGIEISTHSLQIEEFGYVAT